MDTRLKASMDCVKISYQNRHQLEHRWVLVDVLRAFRRDPHALYLEILRLKEN